MKSTEELKNEHRGIERMMRILIAAAQRIGLGESVPREHLDGILEFLKVFVDRCHHGKEEAFLFPALEAAGVPREGGPIGVLLQEHERGRTLVSKLERTAARCGPEDRSASKDFDSIAREYVTLLSQHIDKEERVLFPLAEAKVDADEDARLFEAFERLERERIGPGKHEAFHELLERLDREYLG